MKKILIITIGVFTICTAYAAQIANVEYIHQLIKQKWDVSVKYSPDLLSSHAAANMKYLLTTIDIVNELLNDEKITDYGNSDLATTCAVDTIAVNKAVDGLIKKEEKYQFTIHFNTLYEKIYISAAGKFYLDWGDGVTQIIEKNDTSRKGFEHPNGVYENITLRIGGIATAYSDTYTVIAFNGAENSWSYIDGCLGCIFPTLSDGSQPLFIRTFAWNYNGVYSIPENLFDGITGNLTDEMFYFTFGSARIIGPSAKIGGRYLYEIWPDATAKQVGQMYYYCTNLDDYDSIPDAWK